MNAEFILANVAELAKVILLGFTLSMFGAMHRAISDMFKLAKTTWQKAFTRFLASFLVFLALGVIIVFITGL